MDLKNSCGCIPNYQARRGLHTGTVKIEPHKFVKNTYFQAVKNIKFGHYCKTVWVKVLYQKNGCSLKLQYKHYNGKKQTEGEGGRLKDNEFLGVK